MSISAPANNTSVSLGTPVTFTGTASDAQDGDPSGSIVWTSSPQGQLGTGASLTTSSLSVGTHTVTALVTDSGGLGGSAQIVITVTEPAGSILLQASGYKVKNQLRGAQARTQAELVSAIGQALANVTPGDALNWFAHCGYSFC